MDETAAERQRHKGDLISRSSLSLPGNGVRSRRGEEDLQQEQRRRGIRRWVQSWLTSGILYIWTGASLWLQYIDFTMWRIQNEIYVFKKNGSLPLILCAVTERLACGRLYWNVCLPLNEILWSPPVVLISNMERQHLQQQGNKDKRGTHKNTEIFKNI